MKTSQNWCWGLFELPWQLQWVGVKFFLDDFGATHPWVICIPFNTLKIDRSFVRMGVNGENSEIVRTIITLAHTWAWMWQRKGGKAAQLAQLRALKCEYGQGYCFSKPVDCKAARAILAASRSSVGSSDRSTVHIKPKPGKVPSRNHKLIGSTYIQVEDWDRHGTD